MIAIMHEEKFTIEAAVLWGTIPKEGRALILANGFCPKCHDTVEIVKFAGKEKDGDVILRGKCANCGHAVVRIVETSERDISGN